MSAETSATSARNELATETVVRHLEQLIFEGGLGPGDALPSESELATELSLSRLTIREGIRTLLARGLLEVSKGKRPTVAHTTAEPLRLFFSAAVRRDARGLLELLEVRFAIEVDAAALAARNSTRADQESLKHALELMRSAGSDEAAFNAADIHFHAVNASASGNRMMNFLVEGMEQPLNDSRLQSLRGYLSRGHLLDDLIGEHEEIYEAIVARDSRSAAAAMRRHLIRTRTDLRSALGFHA
jgi:GntR family transcriptional repressor for pyruvate dehydrogenase complex